MCVFKYLVTESDPQKEFSAGILSLNVLCFTLIAVCYIGVGWKTWRSMNTVRTGNASFKSRSYSVQRKITAIIITDFLCWIPLALTSALHYSEVIDAETWYPVFSILILPINSVINPLLYDNFLFTLLIRNPVRTVQGAINSTSSRVRTLAHRDPCTEPRSQYVETNL